MSEENRLSWGKWRADLDEMFVKIKGKRHCLWRTIDQEGEGLERFVTRARNKKDALKFFQKTTRKYGHHEGIVTDRLAS